MTQRDIVSAGIKILGLCLLSFGLINAIKSAQSGLNAYLSLKSSPSTESIGFFKVQSRSANANQEKLDPHKPYGDTVATFQYFVAQRDFIAAIIELLIGVYLCRGGKLVLCFLCGKETKETAQQTPADDAGSQRA